MLLKNKKKNKLLLSFPKLYLRQMTGVVESLHYLGIFLVLKHTESDEDNHNKVDRDLTLPSRVIKVSVFIFTR